MSKTTQRHDIVIYQKYSKLPAQLSEFLHSKGYASQTVTSAIDAYHAVEALKDPVLLVDCGNNQSAATKAAEELIGITGLQRIPTVVIGNFASQVEKMLNERFKQVVTVDAPCTNVRILESIEYLAEYYERIRMQRELHTPTETASGTAASFTPQIVDSGVYQKFESVPQLFFAELADSGLSRINMQGEQYLSGRIDEDFLKSRACFPNNPEVQTAIRDLKERCEKWSYQHLCRVTFITAQILETLRIKANLQDHGLGASFLYASAFPSHSSTLLKTNYMRVTKTAFRKDLCSRLKDSAMKVGSEFKSFEMANIIASMARMIGGEEIASNDEISIIASAIMVGDLTDRLCFRTGAWDPRAANTMLKKVRQGSLAEVHPHVLVCLVKFLSEAALSKPWTFLLPKKLRRDPALIEQARRIRESTVEKSEVKVALAALVPGMKLSRPLLAFDGRKILTEDLVLDQDLIWRLWQLAAVRPLIAPLVVNNRNGGEAEQP